MDTKKNKKIATFSKLDYAVLAFLHNRELSGYDITNRLKHFWKTSHSRIYPTLAKLEKVGFLKHVDVRQADRPDKKVYRLTNAGTKELKQWVLSNGDTSETMQDEYLLKMLCFDLISSKEVVELAEQRMANKKVKQEIMEKVFQDMIQDKDDYTTMLVGEIISVKEKFHANIHEWIKENHENQDNKVSLDSFIKENWK